MRAFVAGMATTALLVSAEAALAQRVLIADLSHDEIAISTGFAGAELLLFGATDGGGDVAVVVRGPRAAHTVRHKIRVAGVWINGEALTFGDVPSFYRVATTAPIAGLASEAVLASLNIGATRVPLIPVGPSSITEPAAVMAFQEALRRIKERAGLYANEPGRIQLMGGKLFRTNFNFPANVPIGLYQIDVHLFRNGTVVSTETKEVTVAKRGLEAAIYRLAHERSALYGLVAIAVAVMAGWFAGVVFRKA